MTLDLSPRLLGSIKFKNLLFSYHLPNLNNFNLLAQQSKDSNKGALKRIIKFLFTSQVKHQ